LRHNCWKARDAAAELEKSSEQKLRQAYRDAEVRVVCACSPVFDPLPVLLSSIPRSKGASMPRQRLWLKPEVHRR